MEAWCISCIFWHRWCLAPSKPLDWRYQIFNHKWSLVFRLCPKLEPCYLRYREWFQPDGFWRGWLGQIYTRKHKVHYSENKVKSITQDKLRVMTLMPGRGQGSPSIVTLLFFFHNLSFKIFQRKEAEEIFKVTLSSFSRKIILVHKTQVIEIKNSKYILYHFKQKYKNFR